MGIELDQPTGKNNGSMNHVQYFTCRPNYGIFVAQTKVRRCDSASVHAKKVSTPVSSGAESTDYVSGSGSISLATSGVSGSSEAEASSPSPYDSPGTSRRKLGGRSTNSSR